MGEFCTISFKQTLALGTGGFFVELLNSESVVNEDLKLFVPIGSPVVCKHIHPYYFEKVYFDRKKLTSLFLEYTDKNYKLIEDTDITKADKTIAKKEEKEQDQILDKGTDLEKEKLPSKKKFDIDYSYVEELKGYKQYILKDPEELKKQKDDFKKSNDNILLPLNQCVLFKFGLPVSPNVDFFGTSKIFSILEISEINREIHYDILPS